MDQTVSRASAGHTSISGFYEPSCSPGFLKVVLSIFLDEHHTIYIFTQTVRNITLARQLTYLSRYNHICVHAPNKYKDDAPFCIPCNIFCTVHFPLASHGLALIRSRYYQVTSLKDIFTLTP